uniref:solute carrier family 2, facilitated glucose transporter member 5-like isoform X2 n=1 Tax=Podarcis muralis TaxID=64176 RepID=UPI00109F4808|nr:solute carrier family 2, facilitated glucose transporter member 5-like isoform X2 [Podarcis muralis]
MGGACFASKLRQPFGGPVAMFGMLRECRGHQSQNGCWAGRRHETKWLPHPKEQKRGHHPPDGVWMLLQQLPHQQRRRGRHLHQQLSPRQKLFDACAWLVYFYTERIYLSTGTDLNNLPYIRLASSVAIIISVFVGIFYIDSMGRKFLLLLGFGMCTILCVVLTMNFELQGDALWMSYVNALLINIFLIGHAVGPSALPNLIIAEIFLQSSRSSAYVVGGFVHWFLNFFSIVTFLNIQKYIGFFSFLICCPICAATFFFILKMIPETTHQTFLEIRKQLPIYVAQRQITKMERMPRRSTRRALGEGQNPV